MSDSARRFSIIEPGRAVAEFLIIVTGVLCALGVESVVTWAGERSQEREYLEALREEVLSDPDLLRRVSSVVQQGPFAWLRALDAGAHADTVRAIYELRRASFFQTLPPARGVFDELTSTGGLLLIRNIELRRALTAYYGFLEHIQPLEDYMERTSSFDSRLEFVRHIDPVAWARVGALAARHIGTPWEELPESDIVELRQSIEAWPIVDFDGFRRDREARASLALIAENGAIQGRLYDNIARAAARVHELISAELDS